MIDIQKIASMDTRMDRVNRLKTATEEFAAMRDAMFELKEYARTLRTKITKKESLTSEDFDSYKEHLDALSETTKNYIEKKGLSPRTEKGRERLHMAQSLEDNALDLIHNLEQYIKIDKEKTMEAGAEGNPEIADNDEMVRQ